ncbi:MAG: hypothetical protein WA639_22165 [Candidatus Acidiferrum sp.]
MSIWPTHWDELVVGFGANVGTNFWVDFGVNVGRKDGKDVFANFGTSVVANLAAHFGMGHFGVSCWADIFTDERAGIWPTFGANNSMDAWGIFRNADFGPANFWATNFWTNGSSREGIAAENMRGNFRTEFGLNREANLGALRKNRGGERWSSDGEMERF